MTVFWQTAVSLLAGAAVGGLGYLIERGNDRQMMRRLDAQPWWPPATLGTKPPTNAQRHRHVG